MAAKECLQVTIIDTLIEEDTLGGLVFLAFLLALLIGFLFGVLIMRYIFREIEVSGSVVHIPALVLYLGRRGKGMRWKGKTFSRERDIVQN